MSRAVPLRLVLTAGYLLFALFASLIHLWIANTGLAALLLGAAGLAMAAALGRQIGLPLRRLRAELPSLARGPGAPVSTDSLLEEEKLLREGITDLVRELRGLEAGLRSEGDSLRLLAESGSEGLVEINRAGRIVYHNRAAGQLLGLGADARGQSVNALLRESRLRRWIAAALSGEKAAPFESEIEDRHLLVTSRPTETGLMLAVVDLTEIRRLESVRRDFVANVSHELKTPLTSIRGYVETLVNEDLPADLRNQFLGVIERNTARLQRIVDDLLDLSRLQSGGWQPSIQSVDAAALAQEVWASCRADARKDIAFDLWASDQPHALADPGGLRQVYANLFDNALRHTPEGGQVLVRIERRQAGHGAVLDIAVRDTGTGIPGEALPRIFERFYRVDPARSRAAGGTGLGLSIVKHLVEQMDGVVRAESELGKGTTIRFRLPAA